jgi:hypothetical protein
MKGALPLAKPPASHAKKVRERGFAAVSRFSLLERYD